MTDNLTDSKLSPAQRRGLEALIRTGNVTQAAQAVKRSRAVFYRWLKQPAFREALRQAEQAALEDLSRDLLSLATDATANVRDVLNDPEATTTARLRAAEIVFSRLLDIRTLAELEKRVTDLEAKRP